MYRGRRQLVMYLPWLLSLGVCSHRGEPTAANCRASGAVIMQQLEAFRQDDAVGAFAFASPEIQDKYGAADNFMTAAKTFYAPLDRLRRTAGFTNLHVVNKQLTQPLLLVGSDGEGVVALYTVQTQPDGDWKILGCPLMP